MELASIKSMITSSACRALRRAQPKRRGQFALALCLLVFGSPCFQYGQVPQIDLSDPRISLNRTVDYYEDVSGSLSFDDVNDPAFNNNFIANTRDHLHFGLTSSAYWLRFSLD